MLTYIAISPCTSVPYLELSSFTTSYIAIHAVWGCTHMYCKAFSFEIMIFTAVIIGCRINYVSYTHMTTHTSVATTLLIGTVREVMLYTSHIASCIYMSHFSSGLGNCYIISLHFSSPCITYWIKASVTEDWGWHSSWLLYWLKSISYPIIN